MPKTKTTKTPRKTRSRRPAKQGVPAPEPPPLEPIPGRVPITEGITLPLRVPPIVAGETFDEMKTRIDALKRTPLEKEGRPGKRRQ